MSLLLQKDLDGLQEMRLLITGMLKTGGGSKQVRKFLENAQHDEDLLLRFLRGRKYRAKYAWETLKRYAHVRFDDYPQLFPKEYSDTVRSLATNSEIAGIIKSRDKFGRRITIFDIGAWDPDKYSLDEISIAIVKLAEISHLDKDGTENGAIFIIQCLGLGAKHMKLCTLYNIRRCIDVFLRAFPINVKGVYYVNVPYFFNGMANLVKLFFPRKLKKRLIFTSEDYPNCTELQELLPVENLPECLGGPLKFYKAVEDLSNVFD